MRAHERMQTKRKLCDNVRYMSRTSSRARSPLAVAQSAPTLSTLESAIPACNACPRLRTYCEGVAATKIKRFSDDEYWGRPAPGFGDHEAKVLIVGLAPAAHGANRTGRLFTGDRSGDVLYAGLHREGFASQAHSVARNDGLTLRDVYISVAARCAPPDNRPTPDELSTCRAFLRRELELLTRLRVVIALGAIAHQAAWLALTSDEKQDHPAPKMPKFGHGREHPIHLSLSSTEPRELTLIDSYHVSQRNTFTGLMTNAMLDDILRRARQLSDGGISTR